MLGSQTDHGNHNFSKFTRSTSGSKSSFNERYAFQILRILARIGSYNVNSAYIFPNNYYQYKPTFHLPNQYIIWYHIRDGTLLRVLILLVLTCFVLSHNNREIWSLEFISCNMMSKILSSQSTGSTLHFTVLFPILNEIPNTL